MSDTTNDDKENTDINESTGDVRSTDMEIDGLSSNIDHNAIEKTKNVSKKKDKVSRNSFEIIVVKWFL